MSRNNEKLLWFAAGALVGATAAVLLAPTSGKALRGKIGNQAGRGRDQFLRQTRDFAAKGRDLYERGKLIADEAADMFAEGKSMLHLNVNRDPNDTV
jgi:gas vesicle protein